MTSKVFYWAKGGWVPSRKNKNAAGWDLHTDFHDSVIWIEPGEIVRLPTNIRLVMPDHVHCELKTRSSVSLKGLVVLGGIIDSDYRGEIEVIVANIGNSRQMIAYGDRIAQMVFYGDEVNLEAIDGEIFPDLFKTDRGEQGFGSSGQ